MTPQTTVILIGLIVFIALEFLLLSFAMFAWKHSNHELPADFKWPRIELRYLDEEGETIASRFYIPE